MKEKQEKRSFLPFSSQVHRLNFRYRIPLWEWYQIISKISNSAQPVLLPRTESGNQIISKSSNYTIDNQHTFHDNPKYHIKSQ